MSCVDPWDIVAERQMRLYKRGRELHKAYAWVDPDQNPLEFMDRTEDLSREDMEAYVFFHNYTRNIQKSSQEAERPSEVAVVAAPHDESKRSAVFTQANEHRTDLPLCELVEAYIKSKPDVRDGTRMSDRAKCTLFVGILELHLGRKAQASDISAEMLRRYSEHLHHLPKNIRSEAKLTHEALCDASRGFVVAKTRFSHAHVVKHFMNWMDDNKYAVDLKNLSILKEHVKKPRTARNRGSLSDEEMRRLLISLERPERDRDRSSDYWVPLLAAFTGARSAELCQLTCVDIFYDAATNVPCMRITDEGAQQELKTEGSVRVIPIHPVLLKLGFVEFVDQQRRSGEARLFPNEARNAKGEFGAFSKRVNRRLDDLGIVGTERMRKDFYSIRHTVTQKLKTALCPEYMVTAITGHTTRDRPLAFTVYGMGDLGAHAKFDAISKLDYGLTVERDAKGCVHLQPV